MRRIWENMRNLVTPKIKITLSKSIFLEKLSTLTDLTQVSFEISGTFLQIKKKKKKNIRGIKFVC